MGCKSNMPIIAIMSGCDWNDASVDHVVLPDGASIGEEKKAYDVWYKETYCPGLKDESRKVPFLSFPEWLIDRRGAVAGRI